MKSTSIIGHVNKQDETPEQMQMKDSDLARRALFAKAFEIGMNCSVIRNQLQVQAVYKELARILGDMPHRLSAMTYEEEYFFKCYLPPMLKCGLDAMLKYIQDGNSLSQNEIDRARTRIEELEAEVEVMKAKYVGDHSWENGIGAALHLF